MLDEWDKAPTDAVIYGMLFFDDGTAAHHTGRDLYWAHDFGEGPVWAHDDDRNGLLRRLPWVKFGRWTTLDKFGVAQAEAAKDADEWYKKFFPEASQQKGCCD